MATRKEKDACDLLDADHREVKAMFKEYDEISGSKSKASMQRKQELAEQICTALKVHTQIEDEIFYPAVRAAIRDSDMMDEASIEHDSAKQLIEKIESSEPGEEKFDSYVKVLGEYIDHHVKEERTEMFPKARAARGLDLMQLREELEARKAELMGEEELV
jgi:hemerythrin-like domain-containing protein